MAGLIWTFAIALVCYIGLGIVFRHLKTYSRNDFSHVVRSLLIRTENGAYCRLDHKGSDVWLSFERASGAGQSAILSLRIPRGAWSEAVADELKDRFVAHGFDYRAETDNLSLLAIVAISVDDIWDSASGAKGSHAARIFLETIGVPVGARFKAIEVGQPSRRALENPDLIDKN